MAEDILINDGGAPARILPFEAGAAITAGDVLSINTSGQVVKADTDLAAGHIEYMVGVSLTDTASGDICNVITGKGIILRVNCADVTAGKALKVGATAGQLAATTVLGTTCAVCLEDTGAAGLHRVLIIGG
jgi:hypothetical protein|tara:strand:- start:55 stop:447 length:393 start_codon:yes stop_codon:yes gene_type:complete